MSKKRQLAAIMFTDIEGYTAIMQRDEAHAVRMRKAHREIFHSTTEKYGGKILQYYGDGTLSVFDSAIASVECGIEMQLAFQKYSNPDLKETAIPVRIGIHSGDIIYSEEEIIGDSVNVTSRIESLATSGSVLISDKVFDEIKNQASIETQSLGFFEFKNVIKQLEVYAISNKGLVVPDPKDIHQKARKLEKKGSFIKTFFNRAQFQLIVGYCAGVWALLQFTGWAVNRYQISPYWVDVLLVSLLSLIPSLLIYLWRRSHRFQSKVNSLARLILPANLVASVFLVIILFKGTDLGATTTLISLVDEEGQTIERTVAKPEFRKKIMLYFPVNESGEDALDWLSYGIPDMIYMDLIQDSYMEAFDFTHGGFSLEPIIKAGYSDLIDLPLVLEKEIAENKHLDYFLTGSFTRNSDAYAVKMQLYQTRNGRLIKEYNLENINLMVLVDHLSALLKRDMKVPAYHLENVDDLPLAEITTTSLIAYEWYINGVVEFTLNNDLGRAKEYLNNAVQVDETFSLAYTILYSVYLSSSQSEMAAQLFEPLMNHLYKLPERLQFFAKASYYEHNKEYDKQFAVYKMRVKLFPEDIEARLELISQHGARNQIDEAIAQYKYILELDPERHSICKNIGSLYKQQGKYDEALIYFKRYAELVPESPEPFRLLGSMYQTLGEFDEARSSFTNALILKPENISDLLQLADIDLITGHFEKALSQYNEALDICSSSEEKALAYLRLQQYYEIRGCRSKALQYLYLQQAEWEQFSVPMTITTSKIRLFDHFVELESEEVILKTLRTLESELDPLVKEFISIGYLHWHLHRENVEDALKEIGRVENMIQELGWDILRPIPLKARGQLHEIRFEYDSAIQHYIEQQQIEPSKTGVLLDLGRCYRELRDHTKAEEILQKVLIIYPFSPAVNYQMALVYHETGNSEKALEHINRTLTTWEYADPDYEPAILAREKLEEWQGS